MPVHDEFELSPKKTKYYVVLRLLNVTNPANAEPNNQIAAGTGTTVGVNSYSIVTSVGPRVNSPSIKPFSDSRVMLSEEKISTPPKNPGSKNVDILGRSTPVSMSPVPTNRSNKLFDVIRSSNVCVKKSVSVRLLAS